jgi:DNA modification methylase
MRHYEDEHLTILVGDCREEMRTLPEQSVQTIVTSPPYWGLRDYGHEAQLGVEQTPEAYVAAMVEVFREARRVLRDDGTLWLNLGDSYAGSGKGPAGNLGKEHNERHMEHKHSAIVPDGLKPKDLVGIPWRVAFALQADGWFLRSSIVWAKPNPMPESVTDRPTKSHEMLFLLAKSHQYFYDHEAIKEPVKQDWGTRDRWAGKYHNKGTGYTPHSGLEKSYERANRRDVWTIPTAPYRGAHFAVMPPDLVEPCVLAGSPEGGVVLDPFGGTGTTAMVANRLGRKAILIELNPDYVKQIAERTSQAPLGL